MPSTISGIMSFRGHHLHAGFINSNSTIIDLGAYRGEFSQQLTGAFGCKSYAVEASPSLYEEIRDSDVIKKFNYAISSHNGPITLYLSANSEGNSIINIPSNNVCGQSIVEGITLDSFLDKIKIPTIDLIKVDIEGAEIALFTSLGEETINKIGQITIEFHDFIEGFDCSNEIKLIKNRLISLGFYCIVFSWSYNDDVLFINKNKCPISYLEYLYIKYILKYIMGLHRIIKRKLAFKR